MDYDDGFILQKTVDWSLLNDGMTIPVSVCSLFRAWDESILTHGQQGTIGYDPPPGFSIYLHIRSSVKPPAVNRQI